MMLWVSGSFFLLLIILAFTPAPFWIWYGLSVNKAGVARPPDCIIVLGGGGMPSESGLMRCWYAARAGNYFKQARLVVALPGKSSDTGSSVYAMKKELVLRGIEPERILFEDSGTNTRAQAVNVLAGCGMRDAGYGMENDHRKTKNEFQMRATGRKLPAILLVSSPEHIYRAVMTFRKAGFTRVDAIPAFEAAIESDISFEGRRIGGKRWVPDIGNNITLRYQFWTQLHYEALVLREYFAIAYYWVQGWI